MLEVMGKRLDPERSLASAIHNDLVVRWSEIIKKGLPDEERTSLYKKYPVPENCMDIEPPKLNPEVKASLSESVVTRDSRLVMNQIKTRTCLSALGSALSMLLKNDVDKLTVLKYLSDAGRLLSDLQRDTSITRKSLVLANVNVSVRQALEATEVGKLMFGEELDSHIKTAKSMERTSKVLKPFVKPSFRQAPKNVMGPPRPQTWKSRSRTTGGQRRPYNQRTTAYINSGQSRKSVKRVARSNSRTR